MSTRVPLGAVTVMTRLPPAILSRSRLVRRKGPRWLVASMSSMPSSLCSYSDAKTAAVLMSASTCATWREIWRAAARTDAFDDRSTSTLVTRLSVSRRVTNASSRSDGLLSSSRRAPRRASSAAVAEPIAPVAPVMTTTGCSPAITSVSMDQAGQCKSTMPPQIDAHRGECGTPGLPAAERYTRAIAMGVDFVEIDIRRTPDGAFISYHDDHTPSGRAVRDLTYAALENELGDDLDGAPPWRYLQVRLSELYPRARLQRSHADFAAVHQRLARIRVLDYCARANIPAWVWTVDAEADIESFMRDPRVAVLITDRPDIALRIRSA